MKKIGITGATGRLGRLVVAELLKTCSSSDIVAMVRDLEKASELEATGVHLRKVDYDDASSLEAAFAGLDRLLLISSNALGRRVAQHSNVIDAAKTAGIGHLAYTSAPRATTTHMALAAEHKATEEYLAASGLTYTVLRNNWYTENFAPGIELAGTSGVLLAPDLPDRVASATRQDYAAAAAAVLTGDGHEGKVYELSGDHAWDFAELADTIAQVTEKPCRLVSVEQGGLVAALTQAGMDETKATFYAVASGNIAGGALADASPELSTLIGRPTTPLEETVREMLG